LSAVLLYARNESEWTGPSGNSTYLFPGPPAVLIDAGIGHPDHVAAVASALEGRPLETVLITHGHVDHASGASALEARWPRLVVRGGPGAPLQDGEAFEAGAVRLIAIHTPGHSPDHFCFLDGAAGEVYCGDLARRGGTIVIPASKGGNLRQYLASLERIRALQPSRLWPAHGPAVDAPGPPLDHYIAHRHLRDRQVPTALAEGFDTADEIVARLYPGLSPTLLPAARESVQAHLDYIREGS
jgi:hydroxyacylglutathione hydrolase